MKKLSLAAAATVLIVGVAQADHSRLEGADTDGDGNLTLAEFEAAHAALARERFAKLDDNTDGLLSPDELEDARKRMRHAGHRRHRPDPERIVERLDEDGNGSVSLAEFEGRRFAPDAESFHAADADGSGELSADELVELVRAHHHERRGRDRDAN